MRSTFLAKKHFVMTSAVLIAGAYLLRVWGLTSTSLWYDEVFVLSHAQQGLWSAVTGLLKEDNALPLHGLLAALWVGIAGSGEFSARYLSVLLGTVTTPLVIRLSGSLMQTRYGGYGSAIAYATLPIFVYYTQEVRMYALAIPLATAFAWVSIRLYRTGKHRGIYSVVGILMLATHIYTGLLWAVCLVWGFTGKIFIAQTKTMKENFRSWLCANVYMALGSLPIAVWAVWRVNADATATSAIPLDVLGWIPITFGIGQYIPSPWAEVFMATAVISICMGCIHLIRNRNTDGAVWIALTLILPLVLLICATMVKAKWSERYLLPSFGLGLVTSVGMGWDALIGRSKKLVQFPLRAWGWWILSSCFVGLWLAGSLPALQLQAGGTYALGIQDEWHPRPDFRGAAQYIEAHDSPEDAVVVVAGYAAQTLDYYYDGPAKLFGLPLNTQVLNTRQSIDLNALEILEKQTHGYNTLWLVLWQQHLSDPTSLIDSTFVASCKRLPVSESFINVGVLRFDLSSCRPLDQAMSPPMVRSEEFVAPIRFKGYDIHKKTGLWEVILWWESTGIIEENYIVFVHLLNQEGEIIAQHDHIAGADAYPTSQWREGTYLRNRFFLEITDDDCVGCVLHTGLYTDAYRLNLKNGQDTIVINLDQ